MPRNRRRLLPLLPPRTFPCRGRCIVALEPKDSFESLKSRLDEIVEAVSDDSLPLDEALTLYEEAVGLGLRASDLLEEGIDERRAAEALAVEDAPQAETDAAAACEEAYAGADDEASAEGSGEGPASAAAETHGESAQDKA